jgi:hypothetical protein
MIKKSAGRPELDMNRHSSAYGENPKADAQTRTVGGLIKNRPRAPMNMIKRADFG